MKRLLYVLLSMSVISSTAKFYFQYGIPSNTLRSDVFKKMFPQETQSWYHEHFLNLSQLDQDLAKVYLGHIITDLKKSSCIGKYSSSFDITGYRLIKQKYDISEMKNDFNNLYNLAQETLNQYNVKEFGLIFSNSACYPLANTNYSRVINKINDVCNETFNKKFAEFKLEPTIVSLKELDRSCKEYFNHLHKFLIIMHVDVVHEWLGKSLARS